MLCSYIHTCLLKMCNKCGKCCWQRTTKDGWKIIGNYTEDEIEMLLKDRVQHKGCEMLQDDNDKHICLIHKILGFNRKPKACQEYKCDN